MSDRTRPARLTRAELLLRVEAEAACAARQRHARRLAPALMWTLGIPEHGVHLIHWLTTDPCRSNLEAVTRWIEVQLEDPEFQNAALHTPETQLLEIRMNRRLSVIESSIPS